jgi:hypothetical protein
MDAMDELMIRPLVGGEVIGVAQCPDIAISVEWVRDGVAEYKAYKVTGQVWYENGGYRIDEDQLGEFLGTAHGPAMYGGALDFLAMVVIRLRQIASESN